MAKEARQWLYNKLTNKGVNIGDYDQYSNLLNNEEDRKWMYDKAKTMNLNVGSYDQFSSLLQGDSTQTTNSDEHIEPQEPAYLRDTQPAQEGPIPSFVTDLSKVEAPSEWKRREYSVDRKKNQVEDRLEKRMGELYEKDRAEEKKARDKGFLSYLGHQITTGAMDDDHSSYTSRLTDNDEDFQALKASRRQLDLAKDIINEANKHGNTNFVAGMVRGFGDKFFDISTWDMGLTDLAESTLVNKALDAFDQGKPLSESQRIMLDSFATKLATDAFFGSYLGRGYKAGTVTADSIPFMLEMAINPASAVGRGATKALARYALKRFTKKGLRSNALKYVGKKVLTRVPADIKGAATMTGTTGLVRTAADALHRHNGELTYDSTPTGEVQFKGHKDGDSLGKAIAKAFTATTIENYSEMLGEYFAPVLKAGGRGVGKMLKAIHLDGVNRFINNVNATDAAKLLQQFTDKTQWHGTIGEFAEEIAGGVLNAITVGDQTLDQDEQTGLFNKDNVIDTFLGVSIMGGFFSGIQGGAYGLHSIKASSKLRKADREGAQQFTDKQAWEGVKQKLSSAPDTYALRQACVEMRFDPEYNDEQVKTIMQYAGALEYKQGYIHASQAKRAEMTPAEQSRESAFDNGYTLETPAEKHDAQVINDELHKEFCIAEGLPEDTDVLEYIGDRTAEDFSDPDVSQLVQQILDADATLDGVIQQAKDRITVEVEEAEAAIDEQINLEDGMIHPVVLSNNKTGYMMTGKIVTTPDGHIDTNASWDVTIFDPETDVTKMYPIKDILSVGEVLDPKMVKESKRKEIEERIATEEGNAIDGVLSFNQGDTFQMLDEQGNQQQAIVVTDPATGATINQDGSVNLSFDGGKTITPCDSKIVQEQHNAFNSLRAKEYLSQQKDATTQSSQQTDNDAAETQPSTAEAESKIPTDEKGNRIYEEADVADTWNDLVAQNEGDEAEALDTANQMLAISQDNLSKAEKQKAKKGTTVEEIQRIKAQRKELLTSLQAKVDYWTNVVEYRKAQQKQAAEEQLQARQERQQLEHDKAVIEEQARQEEAARKEQEQQELGSNNVSPVIAEKWNNTNKIVGSPNELILPNGEHIEGVYMLVESGVATASHDANNGFTKTEGFPVDDNGKSVNDRDYERDTHAQEITRQIASEYDSRALQTPVVVSKDGVVLSGNGRTMAGELAAINNTDGAYIEYLTKYPQQYGFTAKQVESMSHPRVVFVPNTDFPYTAETFAKFNQEEMKGQSKTESAVKLGKIVSDDVFKQIVRTINKYDTLGEFYKDTTASRGVINLLQQAGVIPYAQISKMFDGETLSSEGKEIIENTLIGKAFESNPDAVRQITSFKSMRAAVISALAEISNNIALGAEYSLDEELSKAIELVYKARQNGFKAGDKVSGFALQGNLFKFDDGDTVADYKDSAVLMLADVLNDSRTTLLRKTLTLYNGRAVDAVSGVQDIFTGTVESKQEILKFVENTINYDTREQQEAELKRATEQRKAKSIQEDGVVSNGNQGSAGEREGGRADGRVRTTPSTDDAISIAEAETDTDPSEEQKKAGNYTKGHVNVDGFNISIENPKGSTRSGVDSKGNRWSVTMNNTYGYILGTEGVDGDHVDVFLSDHLDSWNGLVFVVDQVNSDGSFDEHKVMYGFNTAEEAKEAYLKNYSKGWKGLGTISEIDKESFKKWIKSSHKKTKPFADYANVKTKQNPNKDSKWEYHISYDKDTSHTTLFRDDTSGAIPIGDGKFQVKADSPEDLLDVLQNPSNGLTHVLEGSVGSELHNIIATRKFDKNLEDGSKKGQSAQTTKTKEHRTLSDFPTVNKLMPEFQKKVVRRSMEAHESVMERLNDDLKAIPEDNKGDHTVHAHYFSTRGNTDVYILEYDRANESFFCYTILNGDYDNAEYGYLNLEDLTRSNKIELDFYWKKSELGDVLRKLDSEYFKDFDQDTEKETPVEDDHHGFKEGDKVLYTRNGKTIVATIHGFGEGSDVTLDTGNAPIMYEAAEFADIAPYNKGNRHPATVAESASVEFVNMIYDQLGKAGKRLTIVDLRKIAKDLELDLTDTELQELTELAIIQRAREISNRKGTMRDKYNRIVALYEQQPTISMRSSERIDKQQYSTPIPISYVADMFIMESQPKSVLEPSAGNGMMVLGIPQNIVHANEIDPSRLDNLHKQNFASVTSQDGTQPFKGTYDAIVTNPPFGGAEAIDYGGYKISGLEKQMALNALGNMADDGRAAIIIGGNTEYAKNGAIKGGDRAFFNYLYNTYNVVDVINISGDLYAKQGTKFPVRLILINGRKLTGDTRYAPVQSEARAEQVTNFNDLFNRVSNEQVLLLQTGSVSDSLDGKEVEGGHPVGQRGASNQDINRVRRESDSSSKRHSPRGLADVESNHGKENADERGGDQRTDGRSDLVGLDAETEERSRRRDAGDARRRSEDDARGRREYTGRVSVESGSVDRKPIEINIENEKTAYPARSQSSQIGSVIPTNTVQPIERALGKFKDIDAYVQDKLGYSTKEELYKALSAEQIDSVALAIDQMENNRGFIIGDMTGVGKGRQAAALIRYAVLHGHKPIFITEKANLFSDIYRDLRDIGSGDLVPFIVNDKSKDSDPTITDETGKVIYKTPKSSIKKEAWENKRLPDGYDFVVITYSQLSSGEKRANPKKPFFAELAKDNILIMDESHNAGGEESNTGLFLQAVVPTTKGVTFLSGTFAKRAGNMPIYALKTNMSDANITPEELIEAISQGGVPLQEIMSRNLVQSAQMIRRERDYTGVTIDWLTMEDNADTQKKAYNKIIEVFNQMINFQSLFVDPILDHINKVIAATQGTISNKMGTMNLGVSNTPFASKTFNLVRQLLFALKANYVADRAIEYMKQGLKPVIAVSNTMEGFLKDEITVGEDIEAPDLSLTLKRGLDGLLRYTRKDATGLATHKSLSVNDLTPEGQVAYARIVQNINELSSGISISPIDVIKDKIQRAGFSIGELTGREIELQFNDDGTAHAEKRTDKDKKKIMREFNNGGIDMLILNQSASTGISLHASTKFKDQRQRVMIFAQNQLDVNTEIQMRGRTDRTGQVHRSRYEYIVSPIPAEGRMMMMFKSKLKSLDANTTSSQKSKINEMEIVDFLNKYGDQLVLDYLKENPGLNERLLNPLKLSEPNEKELDKAKVVEDLASKVASRAALLTIEEQEQFYKDISERYVNLINYLNDTGTNDLEITTLPLKAKTIDKKVMVKGKNPDSDNAFADNTYLEEVEVDVLKKPMKSSEIKSYIEKLTGGLDSREYASSLKDKIDELEEQKLAEIDSKHQENKKELSNRLIGVTQEIRENPKFTDLEKEERVRQTILDANENLAGRYRKQRETVKKQMSRLRGIFDGQRVGQTFIIPMTFEGDISKAGFSSGILMGFRFGKKITPSTITAVYATLDGRRKIEIPLSKASIIDAISMQTSLNFADTKKITLDNWDEKIPNTSRRKAFIITGNILQAYGAYSSGQLVTYSTEDGAMKQGILLPESFKKTDFRKKIPITETETMILLGETVEDSTGDIQIELDKRNRDYVKVSVPKSNAKGGKYFLDTTLRKMMQNEGFAQKGNKMVGVTPVKDVKDVLQYLKDRFGMTATIEEKQDEKEQGVRYRTVRNERTNRDSADKIRDAAQELADELHTSVKIVESIDEIADKDPRIQREKRKAKGWFDPADGSVVVVLPNTDSIEDAKATILHEIVGHEGLRKLVGDKAFEDFIYKIFDGADKSTRKKIIDLARENNWDFALATEEYIAELAEQGFDSRENATLWQKIKDLFNDLLSKAKIYLGFQINDNDLRYMLWRTYQMKKSQGAIAEAENIVMQMELGVGNYAPSNRYRFYHLRDGYYIKRKLLPNVAVGDVKNISLSNSNGMYVNVHTKGGKQISIPVSGNNFRVFVDMSKQDKSLEQQVEFINQLINSENERREEGNKRIESLEKRADNIPITHDNFFINTRGTYHAEETPKREPDYTSMRKDGSGVSSKYWYGEDEGGKYVIRESDHWGGYLYGKDYPQWQERNMQDKTWIASCRWALQVPEDYSFDGNYTQTGKVYLKDLQVNDKTNEEIINQMEDAAEEQRIIDDAKKNGTYLKAPNGNKSNLNPKQWAQVRTKAFKEWFGDWEGNPQEASKVVDENGEPMVVDEVYLNLRDTNPLEPLEKILEREKKIANKIIAFEEKTGESIGDMALYNNEEAVNLIEQVAFGPRYREPIIEAIKNGDEPVVRVAYRYGDIRDEQVSFNYADDRYEAGVSVIGRAAVLNTNKGGLYRSFYGGEGTPYNIVIGVDSAHVGADGEMLLSPATVIGKVDNASNTVKSATDNTGEFSKENDDIRFRRSKSSDGIQPPQDGTARNTYEKKVRGDKNTQHKIQESYQDSMLSVKDFVDSVLAETGNELHDWEDAYKAENAMSSANKSQAEIYKRDFFEPLTNEVIKLVNKGVKYEEIKKYLIAKHGIERNKVFSKRDFDRKQQELRNKENAERVANGEPPLTTPLPQWNGDIKRDYSGLTALTGDKDNFMDLAQEIVDSFERNYDTKELWNRINAATNESLKKSYESGLMDKKTYEKTRDMFEYYIPLRGWDTDVASNEYEYLMSSRPMLSPSLKVAHGRMSIADDPIATIGAMGDSDIIQGNRNIMKQRLLNFVLNNPTNLATVSEQWYVENALGEWEPSNPEIPAEATADEVDAIIRKHEEDMAELSKKGKATKHRENLKLALHHTKREGQEHTIHVMRNGKEYVIYINGNPRVAQAINGLLNPDATTDFIYNSIKTTGHFLARMFTTQNPAFIVSNLSRDLIWANVAVAVKEDGDYGSQFRKILPSVIKRIPSLLKKYEKGTLDLNDPMEKYFDEFMRNGGETGFTQINTADDYKRDIKRLINEAQNGVSNTRKAIRALSVGVEFLNRSAEDITRFATYMTSREQGRSIQRSIWDAKEITVNFNKKGSGNMGAKYLNYFYLFSNASFQSLMNFGRLAYHHKGRMAVALATMTSLGFIVPTINMIIASMIGGDDDEYWNLPEWVRRNNLVIYNPFSESGFTTIPLPHELRPFFGIGEIAFSVLNKKEDATDGLMKALAGFSGMLPIDITGHGGLDGNWGWAMNFAPTAVQPLVEILANKDYFGKPIYRDREYNQLDPEWTKAYSNTNSILKSITKGLNKITGGNNVDKGYVDLNPSIIQHFIEGYTGGAGKTVNKVIKTLSMIWDDEARQWQNVPIVSSFYRTAEDRTKGSQINREYYEALDEFKRAQHQVQGYQREIKSSDILTSEEYAERLKRLMGDKVFEKYKVMGEMKKPIDLMNQTLRDNTGLPIRQREELENKIIELKVALLDELEEIENDSKD